MPDLGSRAKDSVLTPSHQGKTVKIPRRHIASVLKSEHQVQLLPVGGQLVRQLVPNLYDFLLLYAISDNTLKRVGISSLVVDFGVVQQTIK